MRSIIRYDTPSALGSLEETACESALRSVSVRIGDVEGAIRTVVAVHQNDLLAAAESTAPRRAFAADVAARAAALASTSSRLRADVLAPGADLRKDVQLLSRTLRAADLVRRVHRAFGAVRRLRSLVATAVAASGGAAGAHSSTSVADAAGDADVAAAALAAEALANPRVLTRLCPVLADVRTTMGEGDAAEGGEAGGGGDIGDDSLRGVEILETERPWLRALAAALRVAARGVLAKSAETLNSPDVATAACALADLCVLPVEVFSLLDSLASGAGTALREACDVRGVAAAAQAAIESAAGVGGGGGGGGGRRVKWSGWWAESISYLCVLHKFHS